MTRSTLFAAALALTTASVASGGEIRTWVDKDGVIHFSNQGSGASGRSGAARGAGRARGGERAAASHDERFLLYDEHIREAAALYQIPEALVRAVIKVESNYYEQAVSSAGARGLMQLMPGTAAMMQVTDIDDPRQNIFGGVRYLRVLANFFNGNLVHTIAGYNAGQNAVTRHGGIPPYPETQQYVTRVLYWYGRLQALEGAAR